LASESKRIKYKITNKLIKIQEKCIVFIVGNKGVGKSTAARFLANSLNSGFEKLE
jgi:polynucleotide 5'-kinase involved in rRNA processing